MGWSDLPEGLTDLILSCLGRHGPDAIRCRAVCVSWNSAAQSVLDTRRKSVPWLLIPNDQDQCTRTLVNVDTSQTRTLHLPELRGRWICAATNGWLVTIGLSRPYAMHLVNPLSREEILIPPRSAFRYPQLDGQDEEYTPIPSFVRSVILSTVPSDPNCTVLIIYGNRCHLAMCKPGDVTWMHEEDPDKTCCNFNIGFDKPMRTFHVADGKGCVKVLEHNESLGLKVSRIVAPLKINFDQKYFVESVVSNDFWFVMRNIDWPERYVHQTISFEVFRINFVTGTMSRVESLGRESLFLGHNGSISVIGDGVGWCKPNCIYFLDDYVESYSFGYVGCHDMGIFNLATMKMERDNFVSMRVGNEELRSRICKTPFYWIYLN